MIEILNYNKSSLLHNLSVKILDEIELSDDLESASRERLFIQGVCKRVSQSKSVLYLLKIDNKIIGLIALSVTSIQEQPSLQVDYIFVSKSFRGEKIETLNNYKPFRYLISLALIIAEKLTLEVGLRYIVLSPDNDELKHKYLKVDFKELNENWMFLKI